MDGWLSKFLDDGRDLEIASAATQAALTIIRDAQVHNTKRAQVPFRRLLQLQLQRRYAANKDYPPGYSHPRPRSRPRQ